MGVDGVGVGAGTEGIGAGDGAVDGRLFGVLRAPGGALGSRPLTRLYSPFAAAAWAAGRSTVAPLLLLPPGPRARSFRTNPSSPARCFQCGLSGEWPKSRSPGSNPVFVARSLPAAFISSGDFHGPAPASYRRRTIRSASTSQGPPGSGRTVGGGGVAPCPEAADVEPVAGDPEVLFADAPSFQTWCMSTSSG